MRTLMKNPLIYVGILVAGGAGLLWLGAVFLSALKDFFPYFGGFGVLLILAGVVIEYMKSRNGKKADVAAEGKAD